MPFYQYADEVDITYDDVKYSFRMTPKAHDTMVLKIRAQWIEVRYREQADGSMYAAYGVESHQVFAKEEALGLRLVLDGVAALLPTLYDRHSDFTGKLIGDGGASVKEAEAMKLIITLNATESGVIKHEDDVIKHEKPASNNINQGDLLVSFTLADTSRVKKIGAFNGTLEYASAGAAGGAVVQRARTTSDLQTRLVARREAMLEELTQGAVPARRVAAPALETTLADRASRSWEIVQVQAATAARAAAREHPERVKYEAAAEALAAREAEMTVLRTLPIEGHSHLAIDTLGKRVYVLHSGLLRRYRFADAPGARIGGGPVTTQPEEAADALANTVWLEGIPVGAQSDSPFLHRPTARLYWTALAPGGGCKIERSFLDGRGCEVVLSSLLRGSRAVGAVVSAEGLVHAAYVSVRQPGNASLLMVAEEKSHATDANPLRVSVLTIRRGIAPSALMTFGPHLFYSVTASRAIYRCGLDGSECILIVRGDVGMASGAEVNGVLYSVSKLSAGNQVVCLMASDWPLITSKCH